MNTSEIITVRESREEEKSMLRHIFHNVRIATFSQKSSTQFVLSDFDKETEGEVILVAIVNETVAGFVSVWPADHFIHHLYVDGAFQNKGVGSRLLQGAIDKFGLPLTLKCEEDNTKALCFYKQKGFIEKGRGQSEMKAYILFELNK